MVMDGVEWELEQDNQVRWRKGEKDEGGNSRGDRKIQGPFECSMKTNHNVIFLKYTQI